MRDRYDALDARTKQFAIQVILFAKEIESLPVLRLLVKQLVRAATSVAANQRAARRARSTRDLASFSFLVRAHRGASAARRPEATLAPSRN